VTLIFAIGRRLSPEDHS